MLFKLPLKFEIKPERFVILSVILSILLSEFASNSFFNIEVLPDKSAILASNFPKFSLWFAIISFLIFSLSVLILEISEDNLSALLLICEDNSSFKLFVVFAKFEISDVTLAVLSFILANNSSFILVVTDDKSEIPAEILFTLFSEITINSVFKSAVVENKAFSFSRISLTIS